MDQRELFGNFFTFLSLSWFSQFSLQYFLSNPQALDRWGINKKIIVGEKVLKIKIMQSIKLMVPLWILNIQSFGIAQTIFSRNDLFI